ncbi:Hsp33 family molecular chaperone HslO, partial [Acinetobacter baumannii]
MTLQLQGDGAISLLVAQCTHDFRLRAVARYDGQRVEANAASDAESFKRLVGNSGRVTVTVEADERSSRYQG